MNPTPTNSFLLPADPKAGYLAHRAEIDQAIHAALESGQIILGPEVVAFEKEFAAFLGAGFAVGVGNGTDALHLALRACGIGPGDAVITVSHTAVATVCAIELAGAEPHLVDIRSEDFALDPSRLEPVIAAIRKSSKARLKAIIPVHLYGHPAPMEAIGAIAREHGLLVIEDCAQSCGATLKGRQTGTLGDIAAFSFYPTKNLGALGDGGAVVTNRPDLAEKVRILREYGWRERYISEVQGFNSRLDELQAAILRVKLRHLRAENEVRQRLATDYAAGLKECNLLLPGVVQGSTHIYHQYVIRTSGRDALRAYLKANGIGTLIHYPLPVHLQGAYANRVPCHPAGLPVTEKVCREILSLPMHPFLPPGAVAKVCDAVRDWLASQPVS